MTKVRCTINKKKILNLFSMEAINTPRSRVKNPIIISCSLHRLNTKVPSAGPSPQPWATSLICWHPGLAKLKTYVPCARLSLLDVDLDWRPLLSGPAVTYSVLIASRTPSRPTYWRSNCIWIDVSSKVASRDRQMSKYKQCSSTTQLFLRRKRTSKMNL